MASLATLIKDEKTDDISFVKLHSTLCFFMTWFHKDKYPKLAYFIVRHIGLLLAYPDVVSSPSYRDLYVQLLEQWQYMTATVLKQRRILTSGPKSTHWCIKRLKLPLT